MLSLCVAVALLTPQESAAELVGRMLRHYDGGNSLTGTIRMVQSVQNISIGIDTYVQWEKPSKLFIRQDRKNSEARSFFVTSDGTLFSYDLPEERVGAPGERLVEQVTQAGKQLTYREIYAVASRSLADRSAPLDIAIARTDDLKYIRNQWATLEMLDREVPEGIKAVGGNWRLYANSPASGTYEMWIESTTGNLKKYIHRETFQPNTTTLDEKFRSRKVDLNVGPITIVTVWDLDLKVGGSPDASLFKVIK